LWTSYCICDIFLFSFLRNRRGSTPTGYILKGFGRVQNKKRAKKLENRLQIVKPTPHVCSIPILSLVDDQRELMNKSELALVY
jgi:hypothetical protein